LFDLVDRGKKYLASQRGRKGADTVREGPLREELRKKKVGILPPRDEGGGRYGPLKTTRHHEPSKREQ